MASQVLTDDRHVSVKRLFLQVGRETRKTSFEADAPVLPSLRRLFEQRFAFTLEAADFPPIYIRDPDCGIFFELESLDDLIEGSLLRLHAPDDWNPRGRAAANTSSGMSAAERRALLDKLRVQRNQTEVLRRGLDALRASVMYSMQQLATQRAEAIGAIQTLTVSSRDSPVQRLLREDEQLQTRVRYALSFDSADADAEQLSSTLPSLVETSNKMKTDLLRRRAHPAPSTLGDLRTALGKARVVFDRHANRFTKDAKADVKKHWEAELKVVLADQARFKAHEGRLGDIEDLLCEAEDALATVLAPAPEPTTPVVETMRVLVAPVQDIEGIQEARMSMFAQINAIRPPDAEKAPHIKRLKAIEAASAEHQAEVRRRISLASPAQHIKKFINEKGLRRTGGFRAADQLRAERDKVVFKEMFASLPMNMPN